MNMHWLRNTVLALATLMLPALGAVAAEKLAERPFTEYGIIDAAPQQGVMVISDTTYHLGNRTTVSSLKGKPASLDELKLGTKVGFNMYGTRAERYISDIWILPQGFDLNTLADD